MMLLLPSKKLLLAEVMLGNKVDDKGQKILANGMKSEYEIVKQQGNAIIPVGCTGFVAETNLEGHRSRFFKLLSAS